MGSPDGYLKPLVALARAQAQEETGRGKRGTGSGGQGHGLDRRLLAHVPLQTPVLVTFRSPGFNDMKNPASVQKRPYDRHGCNKY